MKFLRDWAKNLLLLAGVSFLSLLFLEAGYRIFLFGPESLSPAIMNSIHTIDKEMLQASSVQEAVWELKPSLNLLFKKVRFTTNSQGLRDKEYSILKPDRTFRIAVVGASFTMPDGVAIEDAFHSVLEDRLNLRAQTKKYEVINFAVGGYNLRQSAAVLERKITFYQPDLVIITFCPESDFVQRPDKLFQQKYQPKRVRNSWFYSYVFEKLNEIRQGRIKSPDYAKKGRDQMKSAGLSGENQNYVNGLFSRIKTFSVEHKVPILLLNINNQPTLAAYLDFLKQETAARNFYFLDVSTLLPLKHSSRYSLYRADHHPNKAAHRMFAECLYDFLIQNNLVNGGEL